MSEKVYCFDCVSHCSDGKFYRCNHPDNLFEVDTPFEPITKYKFTPNVKNKDNDCPDYKRICSLDKLIQDLKKSLYKVIANMSKKG